MSHNTTIPIDQHSVWQSIMLHLLPGILMGILYFSLYSISLSFGFPSIFVLLVAVIFILIPFELGYLLFQSKKKKILLKNLISYQKPIKVWEYFLFIPVIFTIIGMIFTFMKPIDTIIQNKIFWWIPRSDCALMEAIVR